MQGVTDFAVQYWDGTTWAAVTGGTVSGNTLVWRKFTFTPLSTSKVRVSITGAQLTRSRVVEMEAWTATTPPPTRPNLAAAANGATASASTTLAPYVASNVTDGDRQGVNTAVWLDNTYAAFPDWVAVDFGATKSVGEIDVYTRQDDVNNLVEPTATQTFSLYGVTAYDVQYWTGSAWATVPQGSVTNNNLVWRKLTFTPVTTSKIRVVVNAGADNVYSRIVEVEAYGAEQPQGGQGEVNWLVSDHLGTPRMVADQTGSLAGIKRHDYLPFGEEVSAGVGGRTTGQGYVADNIRQKFTGKERDNETALDYFLARYYSSTQGRFPSVDPEGAGANPDDPQSWNGYAYARSNPILYTDPDGRAYLVCNQNGKNCSQISDEAFYNARRGDKEGEYTGNRDFFESGQYKVNGEVLLTYVQISIDDEVRQNIFAIRGAVAPIPKATLTFFGLGVAGGVTGGLVYSLLAPAAAPTVMTLGLRAAPLLPVVPSALDKLRNLGLSIEQAKAIVQSPASQKFIDNANGGNLNVIQEIGGKLMRITLDPKGERIISAGIVRANQLKNGIASGRFVEK